MDLIEKQRQAIVKSIEMLEGNYEKLGKPRFDCNSAAFWDFLEILIDYWYIAYPLEVIEWHETREMDLVTEKTLSEQVKSGLHKSFAIPMGLFRLIKTYFPDTNFVDKKFGNKFRLKFPFFKNSKY